MPLTPLPADNTARYKVFYTNVSHQHDFQVRNGTASPAALGALLLNLFGSINGMLYATTIDRVEYAPSGSNIFNIVTTGAEGSTFGTGAGSTAVAPYFVNFIGRSSGGRRVRLAVFGVTVLGLDYRFQAGENSEVDAFIAILRGEPTTFYAIDGIKPTWYTYANAGVSAYYQRKNRP
jgi:hypothetical protein